MKVDLPEAEPEANATATDFDELFSGSEMKSDSADPNQQAETPVIEDDDPFDLFGDLGDDDAGEQAETESPQTTESADSSADGDENNIESDADTLGNDAESELDERSDLLTRIWNAELRCKEQESIVADLNDDHKAAKKRLESLVDDLRALASQAYDFSDGTSVSLSEESSEAATESPDGDENANTDWQIIRMSDFLDAHPIKGLGPKKVEALADLCPTLRDFENLRNKIGNEWASLHEAMPKGIGAETTDTIEESYLNYISSFGDSSEPEPVDNHEEGQQATSGLGLTNQQIAQRQSIIRELQSEMDLAEDEDQEDVVRRAIEILEDKSRDLSVFDGQDAFAKGNESARNDESIRECIYVRSQTQDDWICGFLTVLLDAESEPIQ